MEENGTVKAEGRNGIKPGCLKRHRHWGCGEFQPFCPAWCLGSWESLSMESIQQALPVCSCISQAEGSCLQGLGSHSCAPDRNRALHSLPSNPRSLPSPKNHTQAPLQGTGFISSLKIVHISQPTPAVSCSSNPSPLVQIPLPALVTVTGGCCNLLGTTLAPKLSNTIDQISPLLAQLSSHHLVSPGPCFCSTGISPSGFCRVVSAQLKPYPHYHFSSHRAALSPLALFSFHSILRMDKLIPPAFWVYPALPSHHEFHAYTPLCASPHR